MALSVHIISPAYGFGYQADIELVSRLLKQSGFEVTITPLISLRKRARLEKFAKLMAWRRRRFDINIFLAYTFPEWLPLARKNILIPNVEDVPPHNHRYLRHFDLVVAKTRLTEQVFRKMGLNTEHTGFTSKDLLDPEVPRDYTKFFHSCSSLLKGTNRLIELWSKHPEWPELVATIHNNLTIPKELPSNIRVLFGPKPVAEVKQIRNSYGFHLCTSEAEGYAHYIAESMSCRAVVLTTDGPPMNELIQPDRGILLESQDEKIPMGFSHRYLFKPESVEQQVERAMRLDRSAIDQMGANARAFFLENDRAFIARFPEVIKSMG
jgi:glycosyltransferase involved in cell wall biosynthesis